MTILSVIQTFCQRTGLPKPSFVASSADAQIIQLLALANEVCEDLCDRFAWQELVKETTFVTTVGEDQGAITTIAPGGFLRILQETIYNRTLRLPLYGPLPPDKWQAIKALPTSGPFYRYRIRGGKLLFNPSAAAGQTCAFEYVSSWIVNSAGGQGQPAFLADTDTFVLDERLLQAGLRWKWKAEKGLDYAEEFRRYEVMVNNMAGVDGTKQRISMDGGSQTLYPGIFVSPGNWNLP